MAKINVAEYLQHEVEVAQKLLSETSEHCEACAGSAFLNLYEKYQAGDLLEEDFTEAAKQYGDTL